MNPGKRPRVVIFGWGQSIHTRKWVQGMTERGYEVKLIGLTGEPVPGVSSVLYPRHGRLSYLRYMHRAIDEARAFRPRLVHAHYASSFGLWGWRTKHHPFLVSVWGSDVVSFPSNPLNRFMLRRVLRAADRLTATSEMLKRTTTAILPEVADKISVIPFGVTVPAPPTPRPPDGTVRFCFIKALSHPYGPDVLLTAFARCLKEIPSMHLSLAGRGPMAQSLQQQARQLGITDRVTFHGFLPHDNIYSFLAGHDVMVMPSREESFGVAALEAAACGLPTIATTVGGIPEIIRDGTTGLLVPPDNPDALAAAMLRLARDTELRRNMGNAAYEFVREHYDWEKSLDMMAALYEQLIHGQM